MARALKNSPDLIYQYVHDQVEFTPIYGSLKGAAGTLLDGKGNDFDQSSLMIALLRQAGYTANYVYGQIQLYPAQLTNWLGCAADVNVVGSLLGSAGIPANPYIHGDGSLAYVVMDHVWVSVQIGGTNFVFDPSLKTNSYTAGIDLASAMGYNQSTFLTNALAGSTSTTTYLQNVNRTGLRNSLTGYASNLVTYIQNNLTAGTLDQVIGGKSIVPTQLGLRQTSLPYQYSVLYSWTDIPSQYKTTLEIQHLGIDVTQNSEDIYGKRLTIFYDNLNRPVLRLDGTVLATGTADTVGNSDSVVLTVNHPYAANGGTYADESQTSHVTVGGTNAYFIVNGWAGVRKPIVDRHRRLCMENSFAGNPATSEAVLGESLAALGSIWLAEVSRSDELADKINHTFTIEHHLVGICGQNQSPYVDLPLNLVSPVSATTNTLPQDAAFFSSAGRGSAFEWGVIEQNQHDTAVSTVKLMDDASVRSNKLYDVTSANYATIKPLLRNFSSWEYGQVEVYLNAGWRVILPDDGNNGEGQWNGMGFLAITSDQSEIAHIINGGFKGGYGIDPWFIDPLFLPDDFYFDDHPASQEPIDLATGDYTYNHSDLTLGNGPFPFSLEFKRSYNSGGRLQNGPTGLGWTHNFNITAAVLSDGFKGMGADSPLDAAASIAELYVTGDILQGTKTKENIVVATLCHRWFMDQQIKNVVSIRQPQESLQFTKLPAGGYNPQPGVAATLTLQTNGAYLLRNNHGELLNFDTSGRILTWNDPNNNTVTFTYNGANLQSVNNGMGRSFTFAYTGNRLTQVNDSAGRSVSYGYDASGDLTTYRDAAGQQTTFNYNSPGRIASIYYPATPTVPFVSNVYDSLGRVISQTDANTNTYQYFFSGYRAEEDNPLGNIHVLYMTPSGKVTSDFDALSNLTASVYDGQRRLVSQTLPEGNATFFQFDSNHNIVQSTLVPKPGSTNAPIVRTFVYDPIFNRLTQSVDPLGRTNTLAYDSNGNLLNITGPTVDGLVPQIVFINNSHGQVSRVTDPSGKAHSFAYDSTTGDLLTTTIDPGGLNLTTTLDYDSAGNVMHATDPLGRVTTFAFDSMRRLKQTVAPSPLNYVATNIFDPNGNLLEVDSQTSDPTTPWQKVAFSYTAADREQTETSPIGNVTTYQYDQAERLSLLIDAAGRATQYKYDTAGRSYRVIDALAITNEEHLYTPNGELLSLKDANGNLTTFQYDGFDRLYRTIYPDSSYEQFTYDAAGNLVQKLTRAGQVISFSYDNLNRLRTKTLPGTTIQFNYDLASRVVDATDASGTIHDIYDNAGRLSSVTYPGSGTLSYQYDPVGNLTLLTYPDGNSVTYSYDALNRLTNVLDWAGRTTSLAYDALNRLTNTTLPNGTVSQRSYDVASRFIQQQDTTASSAVIYQVNYAYDAASQIIGETTQPAATPYLPTPVSMSYDADNALTNYAGQTVTHDANGNMIYGPLTNGFAGYTYDVRNRLTGAGGVSYAYDPAGNRVAVTNGATVTQFVVNPNAELSQVLMRIQNGVTNYYVYGAGLLYEVTQTATTTNILVHHYDYRGSTVAMTDGGGNVTVRVSYSPYGGITSRAGTNDTPFLFNGIYGVQTDANGLLYMRARYYNTTICRFVNPDPSGLNGGLNLYSHARGNPVSLIDPFGLCAESKSSDSLPNNPLQWLWDLTYTGKINPPKEEYDDAVASFAGYWSENGGVRGIYFGAGLNGKFPGTGSLAGQAGMAGSISIDSGASAEIDLGTGLQERGRINGQFSSETIGAGGSYQFWNQDKGFQSPANTQLGIYGGNANKKGGANFAVQKSDTAAVGFNFGPLYFGLNVDPARVLRNTVDTYYILTTGYPAPRH